MNPGFGRCSAEWGLNPSCSPYLAFNAGYLVTSMVSRATGLLLG
jgi:hypothetical protein